MNKLDTILKVKNLEFLVSRVIGLDKSDTVNENFHMKIYLISDATFTIEFDTAAERDSSYDYVSKAFHNYIDQERNQIEMNILKQVQYKLEGLQAELNEKFVAFDHVGMKEILGDNLDHIHDLLQFINQFTKTI